VSAQRSPDGRYGYQAALIGATSVAVTCDRCRSGTTGPIWHGIRAVPSGQTYLGLPLCDYVRATLCQPCADMTDVLVYGRRSCRRCGRVVSYGGRNAHPVSYCTHACEITARTGRRQARQLARNRRCETCGNSFTAPRQDARHCSPACRQRAYRQRGAEAAADRAKTAAILADYNAALHG
jgi:hypothetical protein